MLRLEQMEAAVGVQANRAALADARAMSIHGIVLEHGDEVPDQVLCGAVGPGGQCFRLLGHLDTATWAHNEHHSWDTGNYVSWSVGWTPPEDRVPSDVLLEQFLATLPDPHHERPGVIRAIEILQQQERHNGSRKLG